MLNLYFGLSIWLFVIFYFLLLVSPIFPSIGKFRHEHADWLKMHYIFGCIEPLYIALFLIPLAILLSTLKPDINVQLFLLIWYLSFIVGIPIFFKRIKNTVGMNYTKIGIPSLSGASAFAELSELRLRKEQQQGLKYLSYSLFILKENLSQNKRDLKNLDQTILAIELISSFRQKIPYKQLYVLAQNLTKLQVLNEISGALSNFLDSQEIKWTQEFSEISIKKQRKKVTSFIEKYLLPIAIVTVSFLGVLSEGMRTQITNFLQTLQWLQFLGFLVIAFLIFEIYYFVFGTPKFEVEYSDVKEMAKT